MSTITIQDIEEVYNEGEKEPSEYIVEYTLPQFSNTYRTGAIPAEEFDRETAAERVKEEAKPLLGDHVEVTVEFPEESADSSPESRRDVLKYWIGGVASAGIVGAGWWFSRENTLTQTSGSPTPNQTSSRDSPTTTEETSTATPSPTKTQYSFRKMVSDDWTGSVTVTGEEYLARIETGGSNISTEGVHGQVVREESVGELPRAVVLDIEYFRGSVENDLICGLTADTTGHLFGPSSGSSVGLYSTETTVDGGNEFVLLLEKETEADPVTSPGFTVSDKDPVFRLTYDGAVAEAFLDDQQVASIRGQIDVPLYGAIHLQDDQDSVRGGRVTLRNYAEKTL